ncbi:unnamed protein product [Cuscuta epithymum]|uniref:RNase H type-1 domain-containing protein n=1 Tax=Cuscuta epithymum TaxID=186058 RepID=A0AAV0DYW0_9ASTE|nr:unnamed protein product [Cuscuta epithymum]
MIAAFSTPIRAKTVLQAEIQTVLKALQWCARSGQHDFQLESDSEMVTKILLNKSAAPVYLQNTIDEAQMLCQTLDVHIKHIYREMNGVAHSLARLGLDKVDFRNFTVPYSLPSDIFVLLELDKNGIPTFRN